MLNTHVRLVNRVVQGMARFLPLQTCGRLSSGLFNTLLTNQRVAGLLNKYFVDLKNPSIAPYFLSLIDSDDYEFLTDPVNLGCQRIITRTVLGYEIEVGFSVVIGVVTGYQGSDTQTVVDAVYEARPKTFSF